MRPYEMYMDVECPVCGSSEHNQDNGPYENMEGADVSFGPFMPDPRIHLMTCLNCHKCFDAGPAQFAGVGLGFQ